MMTRRRLIAVGVTGVAGLAAAVSSAWRTDGVDAAETFEVTHSDAEWRKLLTPDQYAVLRHEATERPFTSPLLHEERRGTFACAGCDLDAVLVDDKIRESARAGRASGPLWRRRSAPRGTRPSVWCGRLFIAVAAAATSVMSSTTVRSRPGFATV